jgi:hypothetical protein
VETREDLLPGLSVPRLAANRDPDLLPSRPGGAFVEQVVNIDPLELEAAHERDAPIGEWKARSVISTAGST